MPDPPSPTEPVLLQERRAHLSRLRRSVRRTRAAVIVLASVEALIAVLWFGGLLG